LPVPELADARAVLPACCEHARPGDLQRDVFGDAVLCSAAATAIVAADGARRRTRQDRRAIHQHFFGQAVAVDAGIVKITSTRSR
jgi:hypothetical protein